MPVFLSSSKGEINRFSNNQNIKILKIVTALSNRILYLSLSLMGHDKRKEFLVIDNTWAKLLYNQDCLFSLFLLLYFWAYNYFYLYYICPYLMGRDKIKEF